MRDHDIVGRHGGDCFVIVGVQVDAQGAHRLARRILDGLATEPGERAGTNIAVRIGGATRHSEGVEILEDLFAVAEDALADARSAGAPIRIATEATVQPDTGPA